MTECNLWFCRTVQYQHLGGCFCSYCSSFYCSAFPFFFPASFIFSFPIPFFLPPNYYFLHSNSLVYSSLHYLCSLFYHFMFSLFGPVFNSPTPPFKPLFPFILSFLIPVLPSHTLSSLSHSSPIHCSSFLPLYSSVAYAWYCFSIYSTHCPPHLWLLLSCLPSSPVIHRCYQDSTPKKCQHGSVVFCPFSAFIMLSFSHAKAHSPQLCLLYTQLLMLD